MMLPIKKSILFIALWAGSILCASAQVLTLDSVLALIDGNNPMLKEYEQKIKAFDAFSSGANSWMAPMVGAGTFMTPYPNQMLMGESDKGSWMFTVEQEIPNPAKLKANRNFLESRSDVEQQGRAIRFNALRAEAKKLYYQWLVAEKKISVLNENRKIIDLMLKLARIRYPYSQGSLGNIYKAEGRLAEVDNMLLMTRADIEEKHYRLKSLMNLPASDSIMIDTTTTINFVSSPLIYDTAALASQRSDVQQINETIQVMELNQQPYAADRKHAIAIQCYGYDHHSHRTLVVKNVQGGSKRHAI
jgi:outer membrane protein, heavy metal efflux system